MRSSGRPEFAIVLALLGVLLAIGVPSLQRGQLVRGGVCVGLAVVVAGWTLFTLWRSRK